MPAVVTLTVMSPDRAASVLRGLYPSARVQIDRASNSLILFATPDQISAMRAVVQGLDVRNPGLATNQVVQLRIAKPVTIVSRLQYLFPGAHIAVASPTSVLVRAVPLDMSQITGLIGTLDAQPPAAATVPVVKDAVVVTQADPRRVARAIAEQLPHLRASVSGATILLAGSQEDVGAAKALAAQVDLPGFGSRYQQVYRIKNIDAMSVGSLITRSYPKTTVNVDQSLNAISVLATAGEQARIAGAIAQLDGSIGTGGGSVDGAAYDSSNVAVIDLKSAMPAPGQGQPSTTANDIGTAVTQALSALAPDLHVVAVQNTNLLVLTGSPQSIRMARGLIDQLDKTPPLVVLDTEILELDENVARNLGINLGVASISTSFSELYPPDNGNTGLVPLRPQKLARSPINFSAILNLLIQKGNARVLADPRITTISGKTASIRAGDTISILTYSPGGNNVAPTSQIQQLQTGVTLDITPIVGSDGTIKVWLHPSVNSISPVIASNLPTISTRDTQTVVSLHDNETLVIGGLIQEIDSKSSSKVPLLGDIPLVGRVFRSEDINYTRNELIMVVTPHILRSSATPPPDGVVFPGIPTAPPILPTLPPDFRLQQTMAVPTPRPLALPNGRGATFSNGATPAPAPARTPSAFASANVFEYGAAPQNAFASDAEAPQIFYANFAPSLVQYGGVVTVSAIASSNVKRMTIGTPSNSIPLVQIAPTKWQATFKFNTFGMVSTRGTVTLTLNAFRGDGTSSAAVQIPVSTYLYDNL